MACRKVKDRNQNSSPRSIVGGLEEELGTEYHC